MPFSISPNIDFFGYGFLLFPTPYFKRIVGCFVTFTFAYDVVNVIFCWTILCKKQIIIVNRWYRVDWLVKKKKKICSFSLWIVYLKKVVEWIGWSTVFNNTINIKNKLNYVMFAFYIFDVLKYQIIYDYFLISISFVACFSLQLSYCHSTVITKIKLIRNEH